MPRKTRPSISAAANDFPVATQAGVTRPHAEKAVGSTSAADTAQPRADTQAKNLSRDNVETSKVQSDAIAAPQEKPIPAGYKRRVRLEKPHVSVYAHPDVFKKIKEIAIQEDCKPHDLYIDGLRRMLKYYSFDFDALNRGKE